jgi:dipeptidyl-peptidase 4
VLHDRVRPNWIGDGTAFWYRVQTERGTEFVRVEPSSATKAPAFDHPALATALAQASGEQVDPYDLPFRTIDVSADAPAQPASVRTGCRGSRRRSMIAPSLTTWTTRS